MSALTLDMIEQAIARLDERVNVPCGSRERPHLLHPRQAERPGVYICANCFGPVGVSSEGGPITQRSCT